MNEAVSESIGGFDSAQPPASARGAFNRSLNRAETPSEEALVQELEREKRLIEMAMEKNEPATK